MLKIVIGLYQLLLVTSVTSKAVFTADFCMSDPYPCQPQFQPLKDLKNVRGQAGCAERCSQFKECKK